MSATEIGLLLACGALAAIAVCALHLSIRVPGHAILRAVFPMAMGLSLVPRRSAGVVMTFGAATTAGILRAGNLGNVQPAALASLIALGPLLDVAMIGSVQGWRLYGRFVAAGIAANLVSFATRMTAALTGWESAGSRQFTTFWHWALVSFVVCGAIAGLISAGVWFRFRVNNDLRRVG